MSACLLFADINECTAGEHNCQQECRNTVASYQCSCRLGFTLASNGRDCNDVDECGDASDERGCHKQGQGHKMCTLGYISTIHNFMQFVCTRSIGIFFDGTCTCFYEVMQFVFNLQAVTGLVL